MPRRWRGTVATAVAITAAVAGCGGGSVEDDVAAAVEDLQTSLAEARVDDVCALLGERPRRQVGSVGHGRKPTTCQRDLREYLEGIRASSEAYDRPEDLVSATRPTLDEVTLRSHDRAIATLVLDRQRFDVPFVRRDERWLLDDLFLVVGPPPRALR